MARCKWSRRLLVSLVAGTTLLVGSVRAAAQSASQSEPSPKPVRQIELSPLGYTGLGSWDRLSADESVSLDFLDRDRLLFAFNPKKLFTRLPGCPATHEDRMMKAVVFNVADGRTETQADWYLHDHRRYLWPLGSGQLLFRRGNSLYTLDASLKEKPLLDAPEDLLWVSVTPDGKQILVEKRNQVDPPKSGSSAEAAKAASLEPKFSAGFLDAKSLQVERTIGLNNFVRVDGTSTGYADAIQKGDVWLIRFGPSPEDRRNITRVRSASPPSVLYASNKALLVARSHPRNGEFSISAFNTLGHRLWREHWPDARHAPTLARDEDGSRIAISTLRRITSPTAPTAMAEENTVSPDETATRNMEQMIDVLETASGKSLFSLRVGNPILGGHHFALSPDGRQLAVLENSQILVFQLPPFSDEERTNFAALQADAPKLYMKSTDTAESTNEEGSDSEDAEDATTDAFASFSAELGDHSPPPNEASNFGIKTDTADGAPTFKVTSRAVVVDVVVTDKAGRPIRGLQQQDFQIKEDGIPEPVRSFQEVKEGRGKPAEARAAPPGELPANVFTNSTTASQPAASMIVLLDLVNTPPGDQVYARRELIKFLKRTGTDTQFAFCMLSPAGPGHLRMIQQFTRDRDALAAVIEKNSKTAPAKWQAAEADVADAKNTLAPSAYDRTSGWSGVLQGLQNLQTQQRLTDTEGRVRITVNALMQLARYLSAIPGRKGLVWLSGSFPASILGGEAEGSGAGGRNYAALVRQATNLFAQAQIAVYPVDVRGLLAGGPSAAGNDNIAPVGRETPVAAGQLLPGGDTTVSPTDTFRQNSMQEFAARVAERNTLIQVAAETGGKAFYSTNAIGDAIATAAEQTENYYALSYTPSRKVDDGRFRKIKIALACRECQLRYRPGYFAEPSPEEAARAKRAHDKVGSAMQPASLPSREILFAAQVVPVGPKKKVRPVALQAAAKPQAEAAGIPPIKEIQHYSIDIAVGASDLGFLPARDGHRQSTLRLVVAAFTRDGKQVTGFSSLWKSDITPERYKDVLAAGVRFHQEIDVPTYATSLRLGIEDQLSSRVGSFELPLPVPPPPDLPKIVRHRLPEIEPD